MSVDTQTTGIVSKASRIQFIKKKTTFSNKVNPQSDSPFERLATQPHLFVFLRVEEADFLHVLQNDGHKAIRRCLQIFVQPLPQFLSFLFRHLTQSAAVALGHSQRVQHTNDAGEVDLQGGKVNDCLMTFRNPSLLEALLGETHYRVCGRNVIVKVSASPCCCQWCCSCR